MALVIVQTGVHGAAPLDDYSNLGGVPDAVIGDVPHHVAVVNLDSVPHLAQDFSPVPTDLKQAFMHWM